MSRKPLLASRFTCAARMRGLAAAAAFGLGLTSIMFTASSRADQPGAVVDARSIIGNLAPSQPKTRGIMVEARTEKPPDRRIDLDIPFANGSARLNASASRQIEQLGAALTSPELRASRFLIAGHTSATGSADRNLRLSKARAQAVRGYLLEHFAIAQDRLQATGFGASHPLAGFAPEADQQRRVEVSAVQ